MQSVKFNPKSDPMMSLVADVDNLQYYLGDMSVRLGRISATTMGRRFRCEELRMIMRLACCAIVKLERDDVKVERSDVKVEPTDLVPK